MAMWRSVPYLSLNFLLHPLQDHRRVCSSKRGWDWRQTSGFVVTLPKDEADADVLGDAEETGDGSVVTVLMPWEEVGIGLRNANP